MNPETAPDWLYPAAAKIWSRWLPESAQETLRSFGAYSYWSGPKPTDYGIVALNSCLWMMGNKPTENMTDPNGQFAFLEQELSSAQQRGQKAYIIAHCPPNPAGTMPHYNQRWSDLLRKYHTAVEASFYGHDHLDFTRIIYDTVGFRNTNSKAVSVGYIGPSGVPKAGGPFGAHNPAFRVFYRRDDNPVQLASHETYWCDLAKANKEGKVVFEKEYDTSDLGLPNPLTPEAWDDLLQRVNKDVDGVAQKYWKYVNVQILPMNMSFCNKACITEELTCLARYAGDTTLAMARCFIEGM